MDNAGILGRLFGGASSATTAPDAVTIVRPQDADHLLGELEKRVPEMDVSKAEVVYREGLTPDYATVRNVYWGQNHPVNYLILRKAYLEDPIIKAAINITAEAILGDDYILNSKVDLHKNRMEKLLKDNSWHDTMMSIVLELLIYGDSYLELVRETNRRKFFADVDWSPTLGIYHKGIVSAGGFKAGYSTNGVDICEYRTEKEYYSAFAEERSSKPAGGVLSRGYDSLYALQVWREGLWEQCVGCRPLQLAVQDACRELYD